MEYGAAVWLYPSCRPQGLHHVNGARLAGFGVLWTAFSRLVASTPRHTVFACVWLDSYARPGFGHTFGRCFYPYLGALSYQVLVLDTLLKQLQRLGYRHLSTSSVALRVGSLGDESRLCTGSILETRWSIPRKTTLHVHPSAPGGGKRPRASFAQADLHHLPPATRR